MKGLVLKSTGSWYTVFSEDKSYACKLKGNLRLRGLRTTNPVTVGDIVEFNLESTDDTGVIHTVLPRKNYIIRKATQFHKEAHLIAANIDQAFLMISLKSPRTPLEFIDRFLLSAEMFFIDTKIIINKTELIDKSHLDEFVETYKKAGYTCMAISIKEQLNLAGIKELMTDKITLISGISGVGKSSLIKYFNPELNLKIEAISDYHDTGKHSTTFSELHSLFENSYVIDTPGIRSYGLADLEKSETGLYFKDVFHASKHCKFSNCTHIHEPGCAVIAAVKNGDIAESRYKSYANIFLDDQSKHR